MKRLAGDRGRLAIFGGVDGLTMFMGIVIGLAVTHQASAILWHAALGGAAGELVGMTAGQHLSDPDGGWWLALTCGVAGAAACIMPALPFATPLHRPAAVAASGAIAVVVAGVIAWLRPERGWQAIARTYGILAAAAVLSGLTGLI